jgi:hypothetical protein
MNEFINPTLSQIDLSTGTVGAARLWNIFHPADPIAYRLEPVPDCIDS